MINRCSLTFWIDEQAINLWYSTEHHSGRGRGFRHNDTAIETALMLKGLSNLPLRTLKGFFNSAFSLINVQLTSPRLQLHLAIIVATHEVISAEVSLDSVANSEVQPTLLNPLRRQIKQESADDAYDTQKCHKLLKRKGRNRRYRHGKVQVIGKQVIPEKKPSTG